MDELDVCLAWHIAVSNTPDMITSTHGLVTCTMSAYLANLRYTSVKQRCITLYKFILDFNPSGSCGIFS
jgi:hypothetical protein